jgi:disulfide bond formation protein DsbB
MVDWLLFNIHSINFWYSVAGLGLLLLTGVLIYDYFCNKQKIYLQFFAPYVWGILMVSSIGGVATTLLYSEVFGFVPCSLCWLQRVALYPQAILVLTAFKFKDTTYFPRYGMALSIFGLVVAVYHYIYQSLPQELHTAGLVPCLADGTADCSQKIMEVFGFVTFPFLSGVLFFFLIVLYLHQFKASKNKSSQQ